ncbi:MAG: AAA family ATPase [Bacillota bacterium]|nr:AAA family ATPase [Bacillota bacterium]
MTIITKIIIENFQSHENTIIDFDKGLNIITGPSDNGKSAIIRALKWVLFNDPRGTDFIRHGAQMARVTIEIDNGNTIVRERSHSKNRYLVKVGDQDFITFEGFGNEIPQEVINAHGITKAFLDTSLSSSLNIAEQLEGPFLLSETGSVRAKAIGRLIGLHIIDRTIKDCNVDLRRESQLNERVKSELSEVDAKLKEYEFLKDVGSKLQKSSNIIKKCDETIFYKKRLDGYLKNILSIDIDYSTQNVILNKLDKLNEYELNLRNIEILHEKLNKLIKLDKTFKEINIESEDASKILINTTRLDKCSELLNSVLIHKNLFEKINALNKALVKINQSINEAFTQINASKNVKASEEKLNDINLTLIRLNNLSSVGNELSRINKDQDKLRAELKDVENVDRISITHNTIQKKVDLLAGIQILKDKLADTQKKLQDGEVYIKNNELEIQTLLKDLYKALKNAGKCPVCGSNIEVDMINEIINGYR